jgi:2'-5' RNA ligase
MRAFIALPLPQGLVGDLSLVVGELSALWPDLTWIRPESWHVTLAFLGEQGEEGIEAAKAALARLGGQSCPGPRLGVGRIGCYPPRGPWRVLVAELSPPKSCDLVYTNLNRALADEAAARGLGPLNPEWPDPWKSGPKRPFRAHITLARKRQGAREEGESRFLDPGILARAGTVLEKGRPKAAYGDPATVGSPQAGGDLPPSGGWPIEACVLYKSELRPSGAVHTELDRAILARG